MYSVFEMRVRVACSIPKAVLFTRCIGISAAEMKTPSPNPSMSNAPKSVAL
jgi:hypothetical protein